MAFDLNQKKNKYHIDIHGKAAIAEPFFNKTQ